MREMKSVKADLPLPLWEKFFRLYPGKGERTAILRRIVAKLVEHSEDYDQFVESIAREVEDG